MGGGWVVQKMVERKGHLVLRFTASFESLKGK